jgi:ketosteroid isomerase-like protein
MIRSKNYLIFVSAVLLVAFHMTAIGQKASDTAIFAFVEKYDKAWNAKEVSSVDKMLADNYIYFSSTGTTTSRERTLEFLRSPKYILKSAVRSEMKVFQAGDTAVVSSRWIGTGTYNDEPINDDQRCSLVLGKDRKRWKLLSEHCTQIVAK